MKVVQLGECRDLLRHWDKVRRHILRGKVKGWGITLLSEDGQETIFVAGDYEQDPAARLQASLRLSWELTRQGDFRASQR
jgi:hypothetical protein